MNIILSIFLLFIILLSLMFYYVKYKNMENKMNIEINLLKSQLVNNASIKEYDHKDLYDPLASIKEYDYKKLYDPLVNPNRRANQFELPFIELQKNIDLPTRGYPDNYILLGILIEKLNINDSYNNYYNCDKCKNKKHTTKEKRIEKVHNYDNYEDGKKLKLFGRQIYPGANQYEYYALDDNFGNYIKYEIPLRKNEIYDNDIIFIKGFNNRFIVSLYTRDMPRYFPHILT